MQPKHTQLIAQHLESLREVKCFAWKVATYIVSHMSRDDTKQLCFATKSASLERVAEILTMYLEPTGGDINYGRSPPFGMRAGRLGEDGQAREGRQW